MHSPEVPVNRTLVGALAVICLAVGLVTWLVTDPLSGNLWPGAFVRVGTVLAAVWLGLPTARREAAWARVSLWKVLGLVLALLVVVRTRLPLRLLIPGVVVFALVFVILRPKPKTRPGMRH